MVWVFAIVLFGLCCWTVASMMAVQGVEQAPYTVTERRDGFEIREYPEIAIAETIAGPAGSGSDSDAFGRLARYIFGANERAQKMAMTAPVLMDETTGKMRMSFVLPSAISAAEAPKPKTDDITVRAVPSQRVAAVKFSGFASRARQEAFAKILMSKLESAGRAASGSAVYAAYNPPYSVPFLRRHEILIPID